MRRSTTLLSAGVAGVLLALAAGIAGAQSYTLKVAKNAKVTNQSGSTKHETIAVSAGGFAVYTLSGETTTHPKCTSSLCFSFWPPVKVSSAKSLSKAPGIKGKLGVWHRHGFLQLTLAGHPLYTFHPDAQKDSASGEGVVSFGGTWHVVAASAGASQGSTTTSSGTTTTMSTGTATNPYPPY
jgi:predicted lipoprotein with Yx(FWY)xxD motif